jgi:hypothetical protein
MEWRNWHFTSSPSEILFYALNHGIDGTINVRIVCFVRLLARKSVLNTIGYYDTLKENEQF